MGAVDVVAAEAFAGLDEHRIAVDLSGRSSGSQVSGEAIPCSQKKTCALYLSAVFSINVAVGQ